MAQLPGNIKRNAVFDKSRTYRYWLRREWDLNLPQVTFVLLNPSVADEINDDNAVKCCIRFAHDWGFGSVELVNLFGLINTNPNDMKKHKDPIGQDNDKYVKQSVERASIVLIGWGNDGKHLNRDKKMLSLLRGYNLYCLGKTKEGQPRYPSRISAGTKYMLL